MYAESHQKTAVHSADDVDRAISRLSEGDLSRLATAARIWTRSFGLDTAVADADDLVAEAIFRTVSGRRSWKAGVDFIHHLRTGMRSIVDSWRKSARRRAAAGLIRQSDLPPDDVEAEDDDGGEAGSPHDAASPAPDAEREVIGRQEVDAYEAHFAADEAAKAVLEGIWWEMTGPDIQQRWGLTKRQYEAAVLRIRRFADRRGGGRGH